MRNIASPKGNARMAELVDASDSKSGSRKGVQVRFLFRALQKEKLAHVAGFSFFACAKALVQKATFGIIKLLPMDNC